MVFKLLVPLIAAFISFPLHAQVVDLSAGSGQAVRGTSLQTSLDDGLTNKANDTNYCSGLYARGYYYSRNEMWQQCYDTLTKFIETCPNYPHSWRAFIDLNAAAQALNGPGVAVLYQFQAWLKSVLYLNTTDPEYFCQCVEAMPFPKAGDSTPAQYSQGTNRLLAVLRWLILNTSCDTASLRKEYDDARRLQYGTWHADSVGGSYWPLDTTLPSLQDLGLDTLLARHFLYAVSERHPATIFIAAMASPNPAAEGTLVTFGLSKEAYVKIELYDVLGHPVESRAGSSDVREGLYGVGNHAIPLSLHGLPSGTYYARLITAYGEAQTVKIVKE